MRIEEVAGRVQKFVEDYNSAGERKKKIPLKHLLSAVTTLTERGITNPTEADLQEISKTINLTDSTKKIYLFAPIRAFYKELQKEENETLNISDDNNMNTMNNMNNNVSQEDINSHNEYDEFNEVQTLNDTMNNMNTMNNVNTPSDDNINVDNVFEKDVIDENTENMNNMNTINTMNNMNTISGKKELMEDTHEYDEYHEYDEFHGKKTRVNFLVDENIYQDFSIMVRHSGESITGVLVRYMQTCISKNQERIKQLKQQERQNNADFFEI